MQYQLNKPVTRIGREADNDIMIPHDDRASRYHAEIRRDGGAYTVRDLNSTNGTYINDRRVSQQTLTNGDRIRIGSANLTFTNGALFLAGGAVVSSGGRDAPRGGIGAPPMYRARGDSTPIILAAAGVLIIAAIVVAFILLSSSRTNPDSIARDWVSDHHPGITEQIASGVFPQVPLEYPVLRDKVYERVTVPQNWEYSPAQKVTEGIYRIEARATFGIALTTPPSNYNITASYTLTIDTESGTIKEATLTSTNAQRVP